MNIILFFELPPPPPQHWRCRYDTGTTPIRLIPSPPTVGVNRPLELHPQLFYRLLLYINLEYVFAGWEILTGYLLEVEVQAFLLVKRIDIKLASNYKNGLEMLSRWLLHGHGSPRWILTNWLIHCVFLCCKKILATCLTLSRSSALCHLFSFLSHYSFLIFRFSSEYYTISSMIAVWSGETSIRSIGKQLEKAWPHIPRSLPMPFSLVFYPRYATAIQLKSEL